jgi:ATP-binding cassette subfamily B protein
MMQDDATLPVIKRLMNDQARAYAPRYAVAFIFMGLVAGCTALTAWMMKDVINQIFVERKQGALTWIPLTIAVIFVVKGFAAYFQEVMLSRIGNSLVAHMQKRVFDHVLKMDMAFFQGLSSSELITRMSQHVRAAREMLNLLAVGLGRDLLTVVGLVIVMVVQDPALSAVILIIGPIVAIGLKQLSARIKKAAKGETLSLGRVVGVIRETAQGIRIVKSFQFEDAMRRRMFAAIDETERHNNKIVAVKARVNPLMETVAGLSVAAVVLYAGWRTLSHGQTPGEFFAFITALLMAGEPLRRLSKLHLQLVTNAVQVRTLYSLLDTPAREIEAKPCPDLAVKGGEVRFADVSFAYDPKAQVLDRLSFTAPAGKTTALVGLSGSGKTTVLNLMQRLWSPSHGTIRIDGQDIHEVSLASLRRQISLVSQDVFLFEGTIRDNLVIDEGRHSDNDIIAAARAAHADAFIKSLPKGYDTQVGELGAQLSGGQRQRISIARAFLKDAPIILLDEPTSALDSEAEQFIQGALKDLTEHRTTIVIAHRLATVATADLILVLNAGRLVEQGTQDELLAKGGLYAKLHRLQFGKGELALGAVGA